MLFDKATSRDVVIGATQVRVRRRRQTLHDGVDLLGTFRSPRARVVFGDTRVAIPVAVARLQMSRRFKLVLILTARY